ncbi:hypothetical protein ACFSTE_02810 [Aquimarina hainanensis]|uniref:Uncharacterized protein n=1 Tax=Aquimarina hainanensis TaxID=1578017 RepID=A0ABW5N4D2_9FLAO|nr:hypothetical protein [Aquimarina sp. TRL1]QKX05793.1 hypothetical protein HN014_13040 [Aquimarina sp. TRL1]
MKTNFRKHIAFFFLLLFIGGQSFHIFHEYFCDHGVEETLGITVQKIEAEQINKAVSFQEYCDCSLFHQYQLFDTIQLSAAELAHIENIHVSRKINSNRREFIANYTLKERTLRGPPKSIIS